MKSLCKQRNEQCVPLQMGMALPPDETNISLHTSAMPGYQQMGLEGAMPSVLPGPFSEPNYSVSFYTVQSGFKAQRLALSR